MCLLMGLYEDEIDWDADLFGQIGKSGSKELTNDGSQKIGMVLNGTF